MKPQWQSIWLLARKDWDLQQRALAGYTLVAIIGLVIIGLPHMWAFYMGCLTLVTVMTAAGFHTVSTTIISEKKEQTLPFVLSLPLSPQDFVLGKLLANGAVFLSIWAAVLLGTWVIALTTPFSNGVMPWLTAIACLVMLNYFIVLSVTLITESEGWMIFCMVIVCMALNPFITLTGSSEAYYQHFESEAIVWEGMNVAIITSLLLATVSLVAFVVWRYSRRRTFI